jgi:hypothetical protein
MSIIAILIFLLIIGLVVYYIITLLIKKRLTETFTGRSDPSLNIEDSHYYLMTSILPGKEDIVNLKETNPKHTNYYYVDQNAPKITEQTDPDVVSHRQSSLDTRNLTCIKGKDPIRKIIQHYQPYMYDQANIINYYDYPLYRDWRYPRKPIDPKFAVNPQKYCEQNPSVYPCYRYFQKW